LRSQQVKGGSGGGDGGGSEGGGSLDSSFASNHEWSHGLFRVDTGLAELSCGFSNSGGLFGSVGVGLAACIGFNLAFFISSADSSVGNGSIIDGGDGGNEGGEGEKLF